MFTSGRPQQEPFCYDVRQMLELYECASFPNESFAMSLLLCFVRSKRDAPSSSAAMAPRWLNCAPSIDVVSFPAPPSLMPRGRQLESRFPSFEWTSMP